MVKATINGKVYEYPEGIRYGEIAAELQKDYAHDIVLVSVNKRLRELNKMEFTLTSADANSVAADSSGN